MQSYDLIFAGHMCYDEIVTFKGETWIAPGSAVLCGAMVAARIGKHVAAVVKMAKKDDEILKAMKDVGIDTYIIPSSETTYSKVIHQVEDVDVRRLILVKSAGIIKIEEMPEIEAGYVHLAGISDDEFDMGLIYELTKKGYNLSVDMQSFVRQVDPSTREIFFKDVKEKKEIVSLMSKVKLDIVEAEVLTGTRDLLKAAEIIEGWGCPEIVITHSDGVLARADGKTYYEKFSNSSVVGRTGRGDTTFAAYLSRRMDYDISQSLKFAAALVSIKMEAPGSFSGTLEDVLLRMEQKH